MDVSIEIQGLKSLTNKLMRIGSIGEEELDKALYESALKVQSTAQKMIQTGGRSGKIYKQSKSGGSHQSSSPGEPPKTWHGSLVQQITVASAMERMHYTVGSRERSPHGKWLEYGTRKTAPRPWLTPSLKLSREWIKQRLVRAHKNVTERVTRGG